MLPRSCPAIAILGPTASGKSRLALDLALEMGSEIISCDALQVYRGMNIGTAKPTRSDLARVHHHLVDICEPGQDFSAGDYQRLARRALVQISEKHKVPVVAGGTGFYFKALTDGLFRGPGRSAALRSRMNRIADRRGASCLHRLLTRVDPVSARAISAADGSRILRACEVFLLTGKPMSWWQQQPRDRLVGFRFLRIAIAWDRKDLYRRIDTRVEEMFAAGFVEEVRDLLRAYRRDCQAFKAIGYRQIAAFLDGTRTLDNALAETQQESRRYAKRQLTWFRRDPGILWIDGSEGEEAVHRQVRRWLEEFVAAGQLGGLNPAPPDGRPDL